MQVWIFALIMLGFGAAFLAGGTRGYRTGREFVASAHRVSGIVVGIHRVRGTDADEYFPVLRFRTLDGAEIETVGQTKGGSFELFRLKGRPVAVFYDPSNPRVARMDTSSGRGIAGSAAQVALGCFLIVLGIVVLFVSLT